MDISMKWLDNPEIFRVNQLKAHSDHHYYRSYEEMNNNKNGLEFSLNGQWIFVSAKVLKADQRIFTKKITIQVVLIRLWCQGILNLQVTIRFVI